VGAQGVARLEKRFRNADIDGSVRSCGLFRRERGISDGTNDTIRMSRVTATLSLGVEGQQSEGLPTMTLQGPEVPLRFPIGK